MKTKLIVCGALLAAVMGSAVLAGAPGGGAPGGPGGAPGAGGPGGMGGGPGGMGGGPGGAPGGRGGRGGNVPANISGAMRDMGAMLTAIKKEAADPAQAEQALKDLATFERDVAISKTQTPPTNNVDAAKKDHAAEDFRAAMTKLQHKLLDLEDAVVAKKTDDIKKIIADLDAIEMDGHAEFKVGGRG